MPKRITAIYLRVSTEEQKTASQEPDLIRWCKAQDLPYPEDDTWQKGLFWEGPGATWYCDHYTGSTMDRPGMERLMSVVERNAVERVVVWRLDRLGRGSLGVHRMLEALRKRGITFVSVTEGMDMNTPAGRMMAGVLASVAEYELELRKERQQAGLNAARKIQERAVSMRKRGASIATIAEALPIKHKGQAEREAVVKRMLRRAMSGTLYWGGRKKKVFDPGELERFVNSVHRMRKAGCQEEEIVRAMGVSRATFYRRMDLIRRSDDIQWPE